MPFTERYTGSGTPLTITVSAGPGLFCVSDGVVAWPILLRDQNRRSHQGSGGKNAKKSTLGAIHMTIRLAS